MADSIQLNDDDLNAMLGLSSSGACPMDDDADGDDGMLDAGGDDGDSGEDDDMLAAAGDDDEDNGALDSNLLDSDTFDEFDDRDEFDDEFDDDDDDDMLAMPPADPAADKAACEKRPASMSTPVQPAAGGADDGKTKRPISLRSAVTFGPEVKPDRAAAAIRNVSIMKAGPAKGHGFMIDNKMLGQVASQMQGGVPMRFTHPQQRLPDGSVLQTDSLGTHVGRVTNVKMDAGSGEVRGDIEFGKHSAKVPGLGDVSGYLMDLAEADPSAFGLSVVFNPDDFLEAADGTPIGRSAGVEACDLTADPAANPAGLV